MRRGLLIAVLVCSSLAASCRRDDIFSPDLGAACIEPKDCTNRCLPDPTWPNGFCSRDCGRDSDCPVGAACIVTADGKVCLFSCTEGRQCDFLNAPGEVAWSCRERSNAEELNVTVCTPATAQAGADAGVPGDG